MKTRHVSAALIFSVWSLMSTAHAETRAEKLAVVEGFYREVMTERKVERAPAYFAETYYADKPMKTADGYVQMMRGFFGAYWAAIPDWSPTIEHRIVEGDTVILVVTWRGTHTGAPLFGIAPTGKPVAVKVMEGFRVEKGRIVEQFDVVDRSKLYVGLGMLAPQFASR
jgi:predicted ester cyclase